MLKEINRAFYCRDPSLEKWSRSEPISFARYTILIDMTSRGVEICFASIMQASAKPCRVFPDFSPVFSCFSCLHQPSLRSPSYVMIMLVRDWSLSAWCEYLAFRWVLFWLFWYFQAISELNLQQLNQQLKQHEEAETPGTAVVGAVHYCIYLVYFACELRPFGSLQPFVYWFNLLMITSK